MYDEKDVAIVTQTINMVGPTSPKLRARLIFEAALRAGVSVADLEQAIEWYHTCGSLRGVL